MRARGMRRHIQTSETRFVSIFGEDQYTGRKANKRTVSSIAPVTIF